MGETGARPDNGDDLQSAGLQGCLLGWHQPESSAPLAQGGLPAQDPAVGAPTYQLPSAGGVLVISEPPHPSSAILGCRLH